jgi:aminopeptidase
LLDLVNGKRLPWPMMDRNGMHAFAALALDAGLGVGPGTLLRVTAEFPHRALLHVIAEEAYARGAALVRLDYDDERLARIRADGSREQYLDAISTLLQKDSEIYAQEGWSLLRVVGYEDAAVMEGADQERLTRIQRARSKALRPLREAQMASRIPWCVIPAPTDAWARTVFGETGSADRLWQTLLSILRLDAPDPSAAVRAHMSGLTARAQKLDALALRSLRFVGPGTDLRVALSPHSHWMGGAGTTPTGTPFTPNIPSEEVFTTPDFRGTEGFVSATRRARIHGTVVEGIRLEFRGGVVAASTATRGAEALSKFLETDGGSRSLGEVALVDCESPIWKSGLVFDSMLLDENAACHVALGAAYDLAFRGAEKMNEKRKKESGVNTSFVHEDFMIGSPEVDVTGTDASGKELPIITRGHFAF